MLPEYKGDLDLKSKKELQYPGAPNKKQRIQDAVEGPITDTIRELGLKTVHEYSRICRKLKQYGRVPVPIDGHKEGCNGPLKAVLVQLNIPQGYKTNMFRHWIVSYMAENVSYFHLRMRSYLKRHNMNYNSYLWQVFNGSIWIDRYMLGAITRMLNVTISIVTPASGLVWNVYHDIATPDIVLIANGVDFEKGITHISATKGEEKMWHCVGHDSSVGEIARFLGESEGVRQAIAIFTISDNYEVLVKMQKFLGDLEEACEDLKNLCIRRDQMLKQLNVIGVDSKGLSRFKRYTVVESSEISDEVDVSQENIVRVLDKSEGELSRKSDPLESTQKMLKQRKKSIDVSIGQYTMGMKTIKKIMQTEPKQKPKQQLPILPPDFTVPDIITMPDMKEKEMVKYCEDREEGEIMDISDDRDITDDNMSEGSEDNLLNQSFNPVQDHEYRGNDVRIKSNQKSITIKPVDITLPKSVITEQPQGIKGSLRRYEDLSGNVSDDTQCVYGESDMIVSKKVAEFLERNYVPGQIDPSKEKKKRKRENSLDKSVPSVGRQKDENLSSVRVHITGMVQSGPSVGRQQKDENVSTDHVHRTGIVQSGLTGQCTMGMKTTRRIETEAKQKPKQQLPSLSPEFTVSDIIKMSDKREKEMVNYSEDQEEGEIMDVTDDTGITDDNMSEGSEDNLISLNLNHVQDHEYRENDVRIKSNQKSIFIKPVDITPPKSVITEQPQGIKGNLPRYEDLPGNVSDDTQCVYGESDLIVSKKVAEFLEGNYVPGQIDPSNEKKKKRKRKREKSLDESIPSVARQKDRSVSPVRVHTTGMVHGGPSMGKQKDESDPTVATEKDENISTVRVHPRGIVLSVTRQKDEIKTGMIQKFASGRQYDPPIRIEHQEVGYVYCHKCPAKYKSKYQLKKHWLRVCPGNPNKEVLICTYCSKTFKWEHNLKDHMMIHTGDYRHHCKEPNCGQSFRYQKEIGRHRVNVHGQVSKMEELIDDSDEDSE